MTAVEHQPNRQRFCLCIDDAEAELTYELDAQQVTFTHTYVPFSLRGKGIAEYMVEEGLAWARKSGLSISTTCWYVEKYLKEHKD